MFRFASVLRRTRSVQMSRRSRPHVAHRLEPLESRRLLSDTPLRPDLVATSDTGVSDTDNITRSDNASPERALQCLVGNTTPGANVMLLIDGQLAGSATALGPSTLVTVKSELDVADGDHVASARQTAPGDTQSAESPPLVFGVDTVGPGAPAAPDLVPASDTGPSSTDDLSNDTTPTFSVTPGITYRTQIDGTVNNTLQTAGTFTTGVLAHGTHSVAIW